MQNISSPSQAQKFSHPGLNPSVGRGNPVFEPSFDLIRGEHYSLKGLEYQYKDACLTRLEKDKMNDLGYLKIQLGARCGCLRLGSNVGAFVAEEIDELVNCILNQKPLSSIPSSIISEITFHLLDGAKNSGRSAFLRYLQMVIRIDRLQTCYKGLEIPESREKWLLVLKYLNVLSDDLLCNLFENESELVSWSGKVASLKSAQEECQILMDSLEIKIQANPGVQVKLYPGARFYNARHPDHAPWKEYHYLSQKFPYSISTTSLVWLTDESLIEMEAERKNFCEEVRPLIKS